MQPVSMKLPIFETIALGLKAYFRHIKQFLLFFVVSSFLFLIPVGLVALCLANAGQLSITGGLTEGRIFAVVVGIVLFYIFILGYVLSFLHGALKAVDLPSLTLKDFFRGWFYLPKYALFMLILVLGIIAVNIGFIIFAFGMDFFSALHHSSSVSQWQNQMNEISDFMAASVFKAVIICLLSVALSIFMFWSSFAFAKLPFVILDNQHGIFASIRRSFSLVKGSRFRLFLLSIVQFAVISMPFIVTLTVVFMLTEGDGTKKWEEGSVLYFVILLPVLFSTLIFPAILVIQAQAYRFLCWRWQMMNGTPPGEFSGHYQGGDDNLPVDNSSLSIPL